MGCGNKIKDTCGDITYATCVDYEGQLGSHTKIEDTCVTIEETTEDLYGLVDEIIEGSSTDELDNCLEYTETEGKIPVKEVFKVHGQEICTLKENWSTLNNLFGLDISSWGIDFGCLQNQCETPINTLGEFMQQVAYEISIIGCGDPGEGGGGGATNLSYTASPTNGIVVSSTGLSATIPAGSTVNASLMLPADKQKLDSISGGATADWNSIINKPSTFAPSAHTHNASDINAGVLNISRIPTGTLASTVALGNHTHTFASLTSKPSTIGGYGITDFNSLGDARWVSISNPDFLRSNIADQKTSGALTFNDNVELQFGTGGAESHIVSTGTNTNWDLVSGNLIIRDGSTTRIIIARTTGTITANMFFESSDERIKENIVQISDSVYQYNLIDDPNKTKRYGTVAQKVKQTNPELVKHDEEEDLYSVNYTDFLCLKLAEQENEMKAQKETIGFLLDRLEKLEKLIK